MAIGTDTFIANYHVGEGCHNSKPTHLYYFIVKSLNVVSNNKVSMISRSNLIGYKTKVLMSSTKVT